MVVLQWTIMPRVVAGWQTNLSLQATSAQRTDYGPTAVLQRTTRLRVVARPQAVGSPVAQNVHPCRQPHSQRGRNTQDSPNKREVRTIFGRSCEVKNSLRKQKLHLMPWCKPQTVAPRGAPCQNQRTSSSQKLKQAGCTTLMKTP